MDAYVFDPCCNEYYSAGDLEYPEPKVKLSVYGGFYDIADREQEEAEDGDVAGNVVIFCFDWDDFLYCEDCGEPEACFGVIENFI